MKAYFLPYLIFHAIILFSCMNDDENYVINDSNTTNEIELSFLHNNSEKKWKISGYYSDYSALTLSESSACLEDEVYTFYVNDNKASVNFGGTICSYEEVVVKEISTSKYNYSLEDKSLSLTFGTGANFEMGTFIGWTKVFDCILLTENEMIFLEDKTNPKTIGITFQRAD